MVKLNEYRKCITDLLKLYHQHPALWKTQSYVYHNKNLKNDAYKILIEKYKEVDPKADRKVVINKIASLRRSYRKELKRVKASHRSATGTNGIYVPQLWYYNDLNFLKDYINASSTTTLQNEVKTQGNVDISVNAEEQNISVEQHTNAKQRPKPTIVPQNQMITTFQQNLLGLASDHLKSHDEYENLGITWGKNVKKMRTDQQIHVKKAVNDIMYEGLLGTLHRHSIQINKP